MPSTIKVRFLIDREQKRVVFAEAGSDFVDLLFSFLTLPLGRIVRLLSKQSCFGSLDNLYESVEQLDVKHLQTEACKNMLLNPRSVASIQCEDLKIKGCHELKPRSFYTCSQEDCLIQSTCYYTYTSKSLCSCCGKLMDKAWLWGKEISETGGVFVNETTDFLITDDLQILNVKEMESRKSSTSGSCIKCFVDNGYKRCEKAPCVHGISEHKYVELNPKSAKGVTNNDEAFVAGSRKFMITDNLHISALSAISAIINGQNLPIFDVVEKEVFVDKYKARSLLSAILASKTVLTDIFAPKPTLRTKSPLSYA